MKHSFRRLGGAVVAVSCLILAMLTGPVAAAPTTVAAPSAGAREMSRFTDGYVLANQLSWDLTGTDMAAIVMRGTFRCSEASLDFWPDCYAEVGMPYWDMNSIEFGDGTYVNPFMSVTRVDRANDVIDSDTDIRHTYARTGPFIAVYWAGRGRPGAPLHINNPRGDLRIETLVDLPKTSASPVALVPPIVDCPMNAVCTFSVPAVDRDRQPLRWRFSTRAESGLVQPQGAMIDAATGLYRWDTTGATVNPTGDSFYSTQVTVENVVRGRVVSRSAVDFFIRLNATTNHPPVFAAPTPADGTVIHGTVGTPLSIEFAASDPDGSDTLTLDARGWTPWSIPGLSFSGTAGNPASGTLSGTPTAPGDYLLNATVVDQSGLGATARGYVVHIDGDPGDWIMGSGYVGPPGTTFAMSVYRNDFLGGLEGAARIRSLAGVYFRSTRIVSIRFSGDTATIVAKGTWGGAPGATATIKVLDRGRDAFGVVVKKGAVTVLNLPIRPLTRGTITIGW